MKLFGLNIGKKGDGATAEAPPKVKAEKPKKEKAPKKERAPKPAKAAKAKTAGSGGELNVYTGVLLAAMLVLGAGAAMIAKTNMDAVAGTADEGNPLAVMSGR
jgi:uncharacterized protein HemX